MDSTFLPKHPVRSWFGPLAPGARPWAARGVLIAALLLLASPLHAQLIPGVVLDEISGRPLSTVSVMLLDSAGTSVSRAESDALGRFVLRAPGAGRYRIFADRLGYDELVSDTFALGGLTSPELELRMIPQPMELDGIVVTTEWRRTKLETAGFYRRQRSAMGYFFDPEDIQSMGRVRTTGLLRQVPGVVVRMSRWGDVAVSLRQGKPCPLKVVLNGFKLDLTTSSLDAWVDPDRIIGMEVYPNRGVGAPVEHRGPDAFCGIIMIWTR